MTTYIENTTQLRVIVRDKGTPREEKFLQQLAKITRRQGPDHLSATHTLEWITVEEINEQDIPQHERPT